jgi:hypothetical protein
VTGQEVQPDCGGSSRLQAEAERTVATWFYQAARATRPLSFAVAGLPIFTWPWAPRRAARTSSSPSKPVRPRIVKEKSGHYGVAEGGGQSAVRGDRGDFAA